METWIHGMLESWRRASRLGIIAMKHCCACILPVFLMLIVAGCEPDDDDVRGELAVTPAATTLTGDERTVILEADVGVNGAAPEPIVYPLEWTVSDPAVGQVVAQSANKAAYTHTGRRPGSNIIIVRDQFGREGLATVHWEPGNAPTP